MFYGWYIVGCAFLVALSGWGLGFYGPGVYLASLRALHGWATSQVSSAVTLYYLGSATLVVFVGGAIDRFGPRGVVLVGSAALGAGVILLAWIEAPWQVFPAFLVMSLGWAAMSAAAINAIVAPWFERKRGLAVSLALNGSSFGGIVVTPLLVYATSSLGFRAGLQVVVALMLAVMILVSVVLRRGPDELGLRPDGDGAPREGVRAPERPGPASVRSRKAILTDRAFLTMAVPFALGLFAQVGFLTHQMSYLSPLLGARAASLTVSLTTVAAVIGRTVTGLVVDRLDRRVLSAATFVLQTLALALLLVTGSAGFVYAGCVLYGLGVGNMITLPSLIVQREFPRSQFSRVVSLGVSVNQFTFAFGPAVLGALRDWWGDYRAAFLLCLALEVVAAVLVLWGRAPAAVGLRATAARSGTTPAPPESAADRR